MNEVLNLVPFPTKILDFLYLGGQNFLLDNSALEPIYLEEDRQVCSILCCAKECSWCKKHANNPHIKILRVNIKDYSWLGNKSEFDHTFEKCFQFLAKAKVDYETNGSTRCCLVHCMRGRSRSATVVMAYLMNRQHFSLEDAYLHCKTKRFIVGPHFLLKQKLIQYQTHLQHQQHKKDLKKVETSRNKLWTLAEWKAKEKELDAKLLDKKDQLIVEEEARAVLKKTVLPSSSESEVSSTVSSPVSSKSSSFSTSFPKQNDTFFSKWNGFVCKMKRILQ